MTDRAAETTMRDAAKRGALGRCPRCGMGRLFARYLKQVENCASCGEAFAGLCTDDAAPWATIILVGHVFLPLMFLVDLARHLPPWLEVAAWAGLFALLSATLLPRVKGMILGVLWQTRATAEAKIVP